MSRTRRPHALTPAEAIRLSRRRFLQAGLALGGLSVAPSFLASCGGDADGDGFGGSGGSGSAGPGSSRAGESSRFWHVAVMADSHVIDSFYEGPESNALDTESILHANERFVVARDFLNALRPRMEAVFHLGDLIHTYPSTDEAFFVQNRTSLDITREILDGFEMPFHFVMGNHDYYVPRASREFTHELFAEKLPMFRKYHAVELHGWKFIHLNNYLGDTWDASDGDYQKNVGSFGEEQLQWFEAELQEGKPSFVFLHHPHGMVAATEFGQDFGFLSLVQRYRDTIAVVMSGHWHRWIRAEIPNGPVNWLIGSTRYDEDAFVVIEIDRETDAWRFCNDETWRLLSHETERWEPRLTADGRFAG